MRRSTQSLVITALLTTLAIVIAYQFPKIVIPPGVATYTLASHVPLFIAMFMGPSIAVAVALGTTLGFLLTGLNIIVVMRAGSHIVFALIGSFYLQKHRDILKNPKKALLFNFVIGLIHALTECLVVLPFSTDASLQAVLSTTLLFVGLGGLIHSMIDFILAQIIYKALPKKYSSTHSSN